MKEEFVNLGKYLDGYKKLKKRVQKAGRTATLVAYWRYKLDPTRETTIQEWYESQSQRMEVSPVTVQRMSNNGYEKRKGSYSRITPDISIAISALFNFKPELFRILLRPIQLIQEAEEKKRAALVQPASTGATQNPTKEEKRTIQEWFNHMETELQKFKESLPPGLLDVDED